MHRFTLVFLIALAAQLAIQLWLFRRQVRSVRCRRDRVPAAFAAAITPADHARAADYTVAQCRLAAIERVAGALFLLALTLAGGVAAIDTGVAEVGFTGLPRQLATVAGVLLAGAALGLPFDAWRTFRVEERFGFNRTTPRLFLQDTVKGLVIGAVIFLPFVALVLWLVPRAGRAWWIWAWGAWAAFSILLGWAWPRMIAPLFNRFRELEAGGLRDAVEALARRCGFEPA